MDWRLDDRRLAWVGKQVARVQEQELDRTLAHQHDLSDLEDEDLRVGRLVVDAVRLAFEVTDAE